LIIYQRRGTRQEAGRLPGQEDTASLHTNDPRAARFHRVALLGGAGQEMEVSMEQQHPPSPMRLLEILKDRFGALEAVANSSIKLARYAPEDELAMDLLVAESVLEFGCSLREARDEAMAWARARGVAPLA
jgi:hypothetical protein